MSSTGTEIFRVVFMKLQSRNSAKYSRKIEDVKPLDSDEPTYLNKAQLNIIDSFNYTPYRMSFSSKEYDIGEDIKSEEQTLYDEGDNAGGNGVVGKETYYVPGRRIMHVINCLEEEHVLLPSQFSASSLDVFIASPELEAFTVADRKEQIEFRYIPHYGLLESANDTNVTAYKNLFLLQISHGNQIDRFNMGLEEFFLQADVELRWNVKYKMLSNGAIGVEVDYEGTANPEPELKRQHTSLINAAGNSLFQNLGINPLDFRSYEVETKIPAKIRNFSIKTSYLPPEIIDELSNPDMVIGDIGFYVVKEGVDPFIKDDLGNRTLDPDKVRDFGFLLSSSTSDEGVFTFQGSRTILTKPPSLLVNRTLDTEPDDIWDDDPDDGDGDGDPDDGEGDTLDDLKRLIKNIDLECRRPSNWLVPEVSTPAMIFKIPSSITNSSNGIRFTSIKDADIGASARVKAARFTKIARTLPLGVYTLSFDMFVRNFDPRSGSSSSDQSDAYVAFGNWWTGTGSRINRVFIPIPDEEYFQSAADAKTYNFTFEKTSMQENFDLVVSLGIGHGMRIIMGNFELEVTSLSGKKPTEVIEKPVLKPKLEEPA